MEQGRPYNYHNELPTTIVLMLLFLVRLGLRTQILFRELAPSLGLYFLLLLIDR